MRFGQKSRAGGFFFDLRAKTFLTVLHIPIDKRPSYDSLGAYAFQLLTNMSIDSL